MPGSNELLSTVGRRMQIETAIEQLKGTRYHAIAKAVLERLPEEWDLYRTYGFEVSTSPPSSPDGFASSHRDEELEDEPDIRNEQVWSITLYDQKLSTVPDAAVKWVIAHELGHVASGLPCGSLVLGGSAYTRVSKDQYRPVTGYEGEVNELVADTIARAWGWWEEEEAWVEHLDLKKGGD